MDPSFRRVDPHIFSAEEYLNILKKCARSASVICTGAFSANAAALYSLYIGVEEALTWLLFVGLAFFLTGMGLIAVGIFFFRKWMPDGLLSAPQTLLSQDQYWNIAEKKRDSRSIQIPIIFLSLFLMLLSAGMVLASSEQKQIWMISCLISVAVFFIFCPFYLVYFRGIDLLLKNHEKQSEQIRTRMTETMKTQSPWKPCKQPEYKPAAERSKQKRTLRQWLADNKGNILEGILELLFELFDS